MIDSMTRSPEEIASWQRELGEAFHGPDGLVGEELCDALKQFNSDPLFLGLEIAEYSPIFDQEDKTLRLITKLLTSLYGQT